jgi:LPS export ABC transporter protein LptC
MRLFIVIGLFSFLLLSCESNLKDVQKIYRTTFVPSGEAEGLHLVYTDSGVTKSVLDSPKMMNYATAKNPFVEFPKGVIVTLYDDNRKTTTVKADKAYSFSKTSVIELQGNVEIKTHDGNVLTTQQLYFDQKNEWFFTEEFFKFQKSDGGYLQGVGIDFSKDFKVFNMQKNTGEVNNLNE